MKNTTLKVKKIHSKVAPGFETLEQRLAPGAIWSSK
jgi:hypothetical protein